MTLLGFTPPGGAELLVILAIVLLFFGGTKLPGLARSLGQAQREFRKGTQEGLEDGESAPAKDDKPAT
jgi:sec-independent protein translocase protein TatA